MCGKRRVAFKRVARPVPRGCLRCRQRCGDRRPGISEWVWLCLGMPVGWGPGEMLSRSGSCWAAVLEVNGSGSVGDELDCCWDVSRFDPDVPVVRVSPEFGALPSNPLLVSEKMNRDIGSTAAANPHAESGHPWSIPLQVWMCAYERSWCIRCVVDPVHHLEKTAASPGSCCSKLNSKARLETFWKAALRSGGTRTRVVSASAKYWMQSIMLFAPSWHPTRCWKRARRRQDRWFLGGDDRLEREPTQE